MHKWFGCGNEKELKQTPLWQKLIVYEHGIDKIDDGMDIMELRKK
jgi:hypothetical protein